MPNHFLTTASEDENYEALEQQIKSIQQQPTPAEGWLPTLFSGTTTQSTSNTPTKISLDNVVGLSDRLEQTANTTDITDINESMAKLANQVNQKANSIMVLKTTNSLAMVTKQLSNQPTHTDIESMLESKVDISEMYAAMGKIDRLERLVELLTDEIDMIKSERRGSESSDGFELVEQSDKVMDVLDEPSQTKLDISDY